PIYIYMGRDENLLKNFIVIFGCGRFVTKNTKEYGEFIVEKYSDIRDKIVPFFEKYPHHPLGGGGLQSIKKENYLDFKKIKELINKKIYLTLKGIKNIKKIK